MDNKYKQTLIDLATQVRENARVPFSGFKVGAAVLGASGAIYTGCNMELSNMMQSVCAEQAALARATAEGEEEMVAIVIVADSERPIAPCGRCRQMLIDFGADWQVIMATTRNDAVAVALTGDLLPLTFQGTRRRIHAGTMIRPPKRERG